jgi:hypothetical protein
MDSRQFDTLTRALSEAGSRRGLLAVLSALPLLGGLAALINLDEVGGKGHHKRHKPAHHARLSAAKKHKKRKHKKRKQKKCKPRPLAQTCAGKCGTVLNNCKKSVDCDPCDCDPPCGACETCSDALTCEPCEPCCGDVCCLHADAVCHATTAACCVPDTKAQTCNGQCGDVVNNCGGTVNCGPCVCEPACPACQVCDDADRQCVPDPGQQGDTCGSPGQICQADGSCACDATSCPPPADQCFESFCAPRGLCDVRAKEDGTPCDTGNLCTIDDICLAGVCTEGPHRICPTLPNPCQVGICNPRTGECEPTNKTPFTPCDDGNPCTTNDHCNIDGECEGFPVTCQAGKICCPSGPSAGQCKGGAFASCNADIQCCSGSCSSLVLACVGS